MEIEAVSKVDFGFEKMIENEERKWVVENEEMNVVVDMKMGETGTAVATK